MAVKIKSMKSGGVHETYDIQNNAPDVTEGNFVIDGVVVHNSILLNGVKNFEDLMLLSAMGHPGPMQSIPEAMNNRDDKSQSWQEEMNEEFLKVLKPTYGVIVYQEQLQALWQKVAGFTSPEAQEARKAVAKKWTHKLKDIEKKWLEGASKLIGLEKAKESWLKMTTFGRYAFNKCLHKDTLLKCEDTQIELTIEQWYESGKKPVLKSFDGTDVFLDQCVAIHDNGDLEVYEVEFDDGTIEKVTANHRFYCEDGKYHTVQEIFDQGLEIKRVGAD